MIISELGATEGDTDERSADRCRIPVAVRPLGAGLAAWPSHPVEGLVSCSLGGGAGGLLPIGQPGQAVTQDIPALPGRPPWKPMSETRSSSAPRTRGRPSAPAR